MLLSDTNRQKKIINKEKLLKITLTEKKKKEIEETRYILEKLNLQY